jgi:hypothetical protein
VGAAQPISPAPTFCGTRSLTAPVHGNTSATTSMRQSPPVNASRHTWMLSTQRTRPSRPIQSGCRIRFSGAFLSDRFVDHETERSSRLFSGMAGLTRKGRPSQRTVPRNEAALQSSVGAAIGRSGVHQLVRELNFRGAAPGPSIPANAAVVALFRVTRFDLLV